MPYRHGFCIPRGPLRTSFTGRRSIGSSPMMRLRAGFLPRSRSVLTPIRTESSGRRKRGISTTASLIDWLAADLRFGSGRNEAMLFAEAWRCARRDDCARLCEVAELAAARRGTTELTLEWLANAPRARNQTHSARRACSPRRAREHSHPRGVVRLPAELCGESRDCGSSTHPARSNRRTAGYRSTGANHPRPFMAPCAPPSPR